MSMKRYFEILGIPPTKNEEIVKRAYRKKAMKYHPDRNPSEAAKDKFIQVTEAYDQILLALEQAKKPKYTSQNTTYTQTNTTRRPHQSRTYTNTQQSKSPQQSKTNTEWEERVKNARQRYEKMQRKEALENERYYRDITSGRNWKRFKIIMIACSFISLLIILDSHFFSTQTIPSSVESKDFQPAYGRSPNMKSLQVVFDNGQKAWIARDFLSLTDNNFIYLERTPLFKDIKYVKFYEHDRWFYYTPIYSQSFTFPLIPIVLLIPLLTFFIKNKTIYFSVLYHVSVKVMPIFLVVLLFSNDRWAQLITLGMMG